MSLQEMNMNKDEWSKQPNKQSTYEYKYVHKLLSEWMLQNGIDERCVVHHIDDNDAAKAYNEEHYERWGLNHDGTFEYGKYVIFMTHSARTSYHCKGRVSPFKGHKHSESTLQLMSEARKGENNPNYGKHLSDETKRKLHDANIGHVVSDETKEKLSRNNARYFKGKHLSEETKRKLSESHKGYTHTDTSKAKTSASIKAYLAIVSKSYKEYKQNGGTLIWNMYKRKFKEESNNGRD